MLKPDLAFNSAQQYLLDHLYQSEFQVGIFSCHAAVALLRDQARDVTYHTLGPSFLSSEGRSQVGVELLQLLARSLSMDTSP